MYCIKYSLGPNFDAHLSCINQKPKLYVYYYMNLKCFANFRANVRSVLNRKLMRIAVLLSLKRNKDHTASSNASTFLYRLQFRSQLYPVIATINEL